MEGATTQTTATETAPPPGGGPAPATAAKKGFALPGGIPLRQAILVGTYFLMVLFFWLEKKSEFLGSTNIHNLINGMPTLTAMAVAVTIVLVLGEFDLSVPAVAELVSVIVAILLAQTSFGLIPALIIGLLVGIGLGSVNGVAVGYGRASAFVVTLAVSSVAGGLELLVQGKIHGGLTSINPTSLPTSLTNLSNKHFLGFEVAVWVFLIIAAIAAVLMAKGVKGRHIQAIGGNEAAARLAGVAVRNTKVIAFASTGLLAAIAGILFTARSGYFAQSLPSLLLPAYAAAFFGAAAIGRRGFSVAASLFGALYLSTLSNGLTVMAEPLWVTSVVQGIVLFVAVLIARNG
jgi:ribose transport system permease protein